MPKLVSQRCTITSFGLLIAYGDPEPYMASWSDRKYEKLAGVVTNGYRWLLLVPEHLADRLCRQQTGISV